MLISKPREMRAARVRSARWQLRILTRKIDRQLWSCRIIRRSHVRARAGERLAKAELGRVERQNPIIAGELLMTCYRGQLSELDRVQRRRTGGDRCRSQERCSGPDLTDRLRSRQTRIGLRYLPRPGRRKPRAVSRAIQNGDIHRPGDCTRNIFERKTLKGGIMKKVTGLLSIDRSRTN